MMARLHQTCERVRDTVAVNGAAWVLMALFVAVAALDWLAVAARSKAVEYLAKPGCMAVLIAVATVMEPEDTSSGVLLVVALMLSAAGDIFLMLPERAPGAGGPDWFVAGLGAFLLAHVSFIVGFIVVGVRFGWVMLGVVVAVVIAATIGRRVVAAVGGSPEPAMAAPVTAYVALISIMVATAIGTADLRAIAGALLFAGSDSLIAWGRFVRSQPWFPLAIIVTYHVAQALLVLSFSR